MNISTMVAHSYLSQRNNKQQNQNNNQVLAFACFVSPARYEHR